MKSTLKLFRKCRGFSYIEVLIATILIAVALVPALESLPLAQKGVATHQSLSEQHHRLRGKFEEILTKPFSELEAEAITVASHAVPTSYSDAAGTAHRRLVYLSPYDGDNADSDDDPYTGVDADLLWIKIVIENSPQEYQTLTSR